MNEQQSIGDQLKEIFYSHISKKEIEEFQKLEEKFRNAEIKVREYVNTKVEQKKEDLESTEEQNESHEDGKILPFYIDIEVVLDIKKSDHKNQIPYTVSKLSNKYEIDFVSDSYSSLVEGLFEDIQEVITKRCKKLPQNTDES